MFHHSSEDYKEAASRAAAQARVKLEETIQKHQQSARTVIEEIESRILTDRIVRTPALFMGVDDEGLFRLSDGMNSHPIHVHALDQVTEDAGMPKKFANRIIEEAGNELWGKELIADNVNRIFSHRTKQRNLIRVEGATSGVIKGFLSDRFRRLDSRPLLDAFMGSCRDLGLVPYEGVASDTKCRVRAILPKVFEPAENEVMVFGTEFGNSDFGDGGVVLNLWTMRIWCTNLAITEKALRQIHLGGRLPDNLQLSEHTYRLDAETTASAIADVTRSIIGPERVNRMLTAISEASEEVIRGRDGIDKLLGRSLDKPTADSIKALYDGPDVLNLPEGNTRWRLSNAVSWFAQSPSMSADRRLELQHLAGSIVSVKQDEALAV